MKKIEVKIKKLHPDAVVPTRVHEFDGGWDVVATEIIKKSETLYICKLGFAMEIPEGYKLTIVPRSSLTGTELVMQNSPGLGDPSYRGEYQVRFKNLPVGINNKRSVDNVNKSVSELIYNQFPYNVGDRIAQVYLEEVIDMNITVVDELGDTVRGEGGFGSTKNEKL